MPVELEPVLESLEGQPEYFKEIYVEADGKFVLNGKIEGHPKVVGLKKAYDSDHKKVRTLSDDLKKFEGVDLERWATVKDLEAEELQAFNQWREEREKSGGKGNGDKPPLTDEEFNRKTELQRKKYEAEKLQLEKKITELQTGKEHAERLFRDDRKKTVILEAVSKAGVLEYAVDDAENYLTKIFTVTEDGQVVAYDDDGNIRLGAELKPLQPLELLKSKAGEKPHWYPRNSGGGAGGGSGKGLDGVRTKADFKTDKEKADWISRNPGKYLTLPDK